MFSILFFPPRSPPANVSSHENDPFCLSFIAQRSAVSAAMVAAAAVAAAVAAAAVVAAAVF